MNKPFAEYQMQAVRHTQTFIWTMDYAMILNISECFDCKINWNGIYFGLLEGQINILSVAMQICRFNDEQQQR